MVNNNESDGTLTCEEHCRRVQVPSEEELVALDAMMAIKREVRILKERLRSLSGKHCLDILPEKIEVEGKLDRFKMEWNGWEDKRKCAAKKRMILLGHDEPDRQTQKI